MAVVSECVGGTPSTLPFRGSLYQLCKVSHRSGAIRALSVSHSTSGDGARVGEYDVALYDGGQEVARAPKAFVNPGIPNNDQIKAVGRLVDLNRATADALQPGAMFPSNSDARVRIAALGPVEPGRRPLLVQPGSERLDVPREGAFERSATLVLACDPTNQPDTTCMVGGLYPAVNTALRVPGASDAMTFVVDELLPAAPAQPLDATVRLTGGPELAMVAVGDRDGLLDDRAKQPLPP